MTTKDKPLHIGLWFSLAIFLVLSRIGCKDAFTWFMEVVPIFIGTTILLGVYKHFYFSRLVCWFLWLHAIVLMVGGHYTYAEVPAFDWLRDHFHLARNYYDRVGHFMQGFVPALVAREILIRRKVVKSHGWLFFIVTCICLAISAAYELFEAGTAIATGTKADAFLGSQGDVWDTQWDMTFALIGAITAQLTMSKLHDASIQKIQPL